MIKHYKRFCIISAYLISVHGSSASALFLTFLGPSFGFFLPQAIFLEQFFFTCNLFRMFYFHFFTYTGLSLMHTKFIGVLLNSINGTRWLTLQSNFSGGKT
ncbi:unnamed protein product [Albugo candida]|uniref:Uncharacterized protein n=1 Tax=Albugo candida TaxID=65357 RepID=A0A024GD87_9STRA|nr:unnamed protein product [Albugo candida]|eukprot:CCI44653.1 unnamed protein product [Albugo candida]